MIERRTLESSSPYSSAPIVSGHRIRHIIFPAYKKKMRGGGETKEEKEKKKEEGVLNTTKRSAGCGPRRGRGVLDEEPVAPALAPS